MDRIEQEIYNQLQAEIKEVSKGKPTYIQNAEAGFLIAFKTVNKKISSARIVEVFENDFLVSNINGEDFKVPKHDVLWVKTGERWPKHIYLGLKGKRGIEI